MDSGPLMLEPRHAAVVRDILHRLVPERAVWAFGSRTTGRARRHSDLDLAIMGERPLASATLRALRDAFEESDLPFRVDLLDWADTDPRFQDLVAATHVEFQRPSGDLAGAD